MKKILIAASVSLFFTGSSFAQDTENAGGTDAKGTAFGSVSEEMVVAAAAAVAILAGMNANGKGTAKIDGPGPGPLPPVCGAGEELIGDECVPVAPPTTTTVTDTTGTATNTVTTTTPVTVTVTSTL